MKKIVISTIILVSVLLVIFWIRRPEAPSPDKFNSIPSSRETPIYQELDPVAAEGKG